MLTPTSRGANYDRESQSVRLSLDRPNSQNSPGSRFLLKSIPSLFPGTTSVPPDSAVQSKNSRGAEVLFDSYQTQGFHDEMFDAQGNPRPEARLLLETIQSLEEGQLLRSQRAAERLLLQMGITFNVYGDSAGTERIFPFDLIPQNRSGRRMGMDRARAQAAHSRAERIHLRHLSRAEDSQGQGHP